MRLYLFLASSANIQPVFSELTTAFRTIRIPFLDQTLPERDQFRADVAFFRRILLVELAAILLQILADLALPLLGEQCCWPRPPKELLEAIQKLFLDLLPFEVPYRVPVLKLHLEHKKTQPKSETRIAIGSRELMSLRVLSMKQHTVCLQALALVAKYLPEGSHSTSVTP